MSLSQTVFAVNDQEIEQCNLIVNNWVKILNTTEADSVIAFMFTDHAQLNLVATTATNNLKKIKERIRIFAQGKHTIQTIEIMKDGTENNNYQIHLILNWKHNFRQDVARFQERIKLVYSKKVGQFLIDSIEEKFILPDDGLGVKLKC